MKYEVVDTRTGQVVSTRPLSFRSAVSRVDQLDSQYGGYRYSYRAVVEPQSMGQE